MRKYWGVKIGLIIFTLLGFVLNSHAQASTYLAQISKYNEASAFEDSQYVGKSWQQFYKLDAVQEFIDPANYDFDLFNAAIFFAINKYRESKGRKALKFEPRLRDAAAIHSYQMVKFNFFAHDNPHDRSIAHLNNRTELCRYTGERVAENIAKTFVDLEKPMSYIQAADRAVRELSQSPEHNEHLLDPSIDKVGCAALFDLQPYQEQYYYYRVTQDFGRDWR